MSSPIKCEHCGKILPIDPKTGKVEDVVLLQALRGGVGTFVTVCPDVCDRLQREKEDVIFSANGMPTGQ